MASSLLQTLTRISGAWHSWRPILPVKAKVKKAWSTLTFSISLPPGLLPHSGVGPHFFLWLPMYPQKPFLLLFKSLTRFNSRWAFLAPSLHAQTVSLHWISLLLGLLSLLPLLVWFFFFISESLDYHGDLGEMQMNTETQWILNMFTSLLIFCNPLKFSG